MRPKQFHVTLTGEQRDELARQSTSQRHSARERKRARILLLADEAREGGPAQDDVIAREVGVCAPTVGRVRRRFAQAQEHGQDPLGAALRHKEQERRKPRVLDGVAEAHLIALVCATPPGGRKRWSLHLLRDTLIEQRVTDTVSHETVRQTLKKMSSSPG